MSETKRPVGRPARDVPRLAVTVRFEPQELARIDAARGSISRQDWLYGAAMGLARRVAKDGGEPAPPTPVSVW
jgi:hypothetical protein